MSSHAEIPRRVAGVISRRVGEEYVVIHPTTQSAHSLAGALASVWSAADSGELPVLSDAEFEQAVADLVALRLLETPGVSRRSMLKRAGVVAGVAGVTTIALPEAAFAASAGFTFSATTTGAFTTPTIPAHVTKLQFTVVGGGGGAGSGAHGGNGATISGIITLPTRSGNTLTLSGFVGGGGGAGSHGGAGAKGDGAGGAAGTEGNGAGGGGGTSIRASNSNDVIVLAGGGGGAGGGTGGAGGDAGQYKANAGKNKGAAGSDVDDATGGKGGLTGAGGKATGGAHGNTGPGGAAHAPKSGTKKGAGGTGGSAAGTGGGGGGGGGYAGGGGGAAVRGAAANGAGGGGGSSYYDGTVRYPLSGLSGSTADNGGTAKSNGAPGMVTLKSVS